MSSNPVPTYLLPDTSQVLDHRLTIGRCDLVELASEFGTPLFVYDEQHIRARAREAVAAFPGGAAYASKAFLCCAMAELAVEEGMNIDVSTGGEMHVSLAAGVPANRLVLHGNNKSDDELRTAIDAGVHRIVIDSFDEIDRLEHLLGSKNARVLIRITPGVQAHTHEYVQTGQDDSKFGFGMNNGEAIEAIKRIQNIDNAELKGIHTHIGSQIFRTDSFAKAIAVVSPFLSQFELEELCVGGGLGVPYVEGEVAPSITQWGEMVHDAVSQAGIDNSIRITCEPGRSIVAAAGITLYTVGTIKNIPDVRTYVAVDGGMSDNPRPVLYDSGYEAFLPRNVDSPRTLQATLVGKHCESGDLIVRDAFFPDDLQIGDVVATPVTGAYGMSMASNYNNVLRPAVVFVKDGNARLVIRRETNDDLLAREVT